MSDARRVYVAGSTREILAIRRIQEDCRAAGWKIAFDWTGPEGEIRTDGSWDCVAEKGSAIAQREIGACRSADLVIVLCPQTGGLGCWIEMGAALDAETPVWVLAPARDSVFWQHPLVRRFPDWDSARATLSTPNALESTGDSTDPIREAAA